MDAASQRGIDDVREIRERVVLQPVEGGYKVYIIDEAHQLTDAGLERAAEADRGASAPPRLRLLHHRPRERAARPFARAARPSSSSGRACRSSSPCCAASARERSIDAPDAALALIARGARGSFRDAVSTLDQLAAATGSTISVQDVLQLVGGIEEDSLFRLCDTIVDHDTAGALVQIEELAEQGQDIGRLVTELIEHLRQLLLVQHVGHVPESLPVTEETRERLREQANQLPEPTVLRLIDLLAVAVDDMRQGGDPRLPLELALVKMTRPQADLSRDSLAHRVEVLEARPHGGPRSGPDVRGRRGACRLAQDGPHLRRRHQPDRRGAPAARRRCRRSSSSSSATPGSATSSTPSGAVDPDLDARSPRPGRSTIDGDTLTIEFAARRASTAADRGAEEPRDRSARRSTRSRAASWRSRPIVGASPSRPSPRTPRALRGRRDLAAQGHLRRRGSGGALMAKFDMNAMLKQAQQMQAQMMEAQEEAKHEVVEASAGGGMVTVKANGGGELVEIRIDPKAIDPDDPEMLADIVMAAANEALRSAQEKTEAKLRGQMPDLGSLGLPGL